MIEALCGVSDSDIWRDFEITALQGRTRTSTAYGSDFRTSIMAVFPESADDANIKSYVAQWCVSQGFDVNKINRLRHLLIEGNPADFSMSTATEVDLSTAIKDSRLNSSGVLISNYKNASYGTFYVTDMLPANDNVLITVNTDVDVTGESIYLRTMSCYDNNATYIGHSIRACYNGSTGYSNSVGAQWFKLGTQIGGIDTTKVNKIRIGFACNDINNVTITMRSLIVP